MKIYECSSKGDKRFSPLHAIINRYKSKSINYLYKEFIRNKGYSTEFSIRLYKSLWVTYFKENPELLDDLIEITEDHKLINSEVTKNDYDYIEFINEILKNRKEEITMARKKFNDVEDYTSNNYLTGAGVFEMDIIEVEEIETSTGNIQFKIKLECEEGVLYDRVTMTEKSLGFVKRYLSACGYDMDDLEYEEEDGKVTQLYFNDEEYDLVGLLGPDDDGEMETVVITTIAGESSYKDPVSGDMIQVDNPSAKVKNVEAVAE